MAQGYAKTEFADPGWQDWSPSYTNITIGDGTVVARYIQIGTLVTVSWFFTVGSTSTVDNPLVSLPVTPADTTTREIGEVGLIDTGTKTWQGAIRIQTGGANFQVRVVDSSGTYGAVTNLSTTVPFTWTTGDLIEARFTYEAAASVLIGMGLNNDHGSLSGLTDDDHPQYMVRDEVLHLGNTGAVDTLTIASGVITITTSWHRVDTESAAATDELDTINTVAGVQEGDVCVLRTSTGTRDVILTENGNVRIEGGSTLRLNTSSSMVMMVYNGTNWMHISAIGVTIA